MDSPDTWKMAGSSAPLPPLVPGLPILGSGLGMMNDPLGFLLKQYSNFGPIFRLKALNRQITVLAGPEANQFLSRLGDEQLGSRELFGGFADEMNTEVFLTAMDGASHRYLRRQMRPGYSREKMTPHLAQAAELVRAEARGWQIGQRLAVLPAIQHITANQLGIIMVNRLPGEYFNDIWTFLNTVMKVTVMKTQPKLMLRLPGYQRSRRRVLELAQLIINEHRAHPPVDRTADLVDDMLAARDEDGQSYDDNALAVSALSPYIAGIDTVANTCTFMLVALLQHPDILERVQADVDALFERGLTSLADLKNASALYGATLETLRMYPVAAFTPRTAVRTFEFAGFRVEAGSEVLVANGVTHYLPRYFPNPEKFDIDRHAEPRKEHRQAGAFAPYSLGAHTCLGAGLAEVQVMVILASILHSVRLELDPPDTSIKIILAPLPSLGPRLRVRVIARR